MGMEGNGKNILLREGMGMFFVYYYGNENTVKGMGGNGIEKGIPTHL